MKKKIVFIGVALIIATGSSLAQQQVLHKALLEENSITFVETDREVTYEIADIQKMTYEGNILYVFLKDKTIYSVDVTSLSINNNGEKTQDAELIESINKLQVSIYPNPAVDVLKVTLNQDDNVVIYSLTGQAITSFQGHAGENNYNVSNLSSGVYFISAGSDTQKFIVK